MKNMKSVFMNPVIILSLLIVTLLVAVISYGILSPRQQVVLYYPLDRGDALEGELRIIPRRHDNAERMDILIKELLLHPVSITLNPLVPEGVINTSTIYVKEDKTLYVDFCREMLIVDRQGEDYPEDQEILQIIEYNLNKHFPYLEEIKISIDGMVPFSPLYSPE